MIASFEKYSVLALVAGRQKHGSFAAFWHRENLSPRPRKFQLDILFDRGSQWGAAFYGYRLKFWLFYGYRLIFFSYGSRRTFI